MLRRVAVRMFCVGLAAAAIGCGGGDPPPKPDTVKSRVEAVPSEADADGVAKVTVTATLVDSADRSYQATEVTFSLVGPGRPSAASVSGSADGIATTTLTSFEAGQTSITVRVDGEYLSQRPLVTFRHPGGGRVSFVETPKVAVAGEPFDVKVKVEDATGAPKTDATVALTPGEGFADAPIDGPVTARTNDAGEAYFSGLSLQRAARGFTLVAVSEGLSPAASEGIEVKPAALSSEQSSVTVLPTTARLDIDDIRVTVTARDRFGNGLEGVGCSVSSSEGSDVLATPTPTGQDGTSVVSLEASLVGERTVSGTVGGRAIPKTASLLVLAGPPDEARSSLTGPSDPIPADNESEAELVARLVDGRGNPVSDAEISITSTLGTISLLPMRTDDGGEAVLRIRSGFEGAATVTLTALGRTLQTTVIFAPNTAHHFELTGVPAQVVAGTPLSVTVTVKDAQGQTVQGFQRMVTLSVSTPGASLPVTSTFTFSAANAGSQTLSLAPFTQVGQVTLTATTTFLTSRAVTGSTTFEVTPGPLARLYFRPLEAVPVAGESFPPLWVILADAFNNLVTAPTDILLSCTGTSLQGQTTVTSVGGAATFVGISIPRAGNVYRLIATAPTSSAPAEFSEPFDIRPGPPAPHLSLLNANPETVVAGAGEALRVKAQVVDLFGNAVPGVQVQMTTDVAGDVVSQPAPTDEAGESFATLLSTTAGPRYFTGTIGGVPMAFPVFANILPAAAEASASRLDASAATAVADGLDAVTVRLLLLDAFGNGVFGSTPAWSTDLGEIDLVSGSTDAFGAATAVLRSTTAGTATVTAEIDGLRLQAQVTFTP